MQPHPGKCTVDPKRQRFRCHPTKCPHIPNRPQRTGSAIFDPYAKECQARISQNHIRFAFSIHSFTPKLGDTDRPWDIGFLHRHSHSQGDQLVRLAKHLWPNLTIGENQPYMIEDATDWFIPVCAEPRALPHSLIEIRNDHLLDDRGCHDWAERFFILLPTFMEDHNEPHP